jgi:hypothetical protein
MRTNRGELPGEEQIGNNGDRLASGGGSGARPAGGRPLGRVATAAAAFAGICACDTPRLSVWRANRKCPSLANGPVLRRPQMASPGSWQTSCKTSCCPLPNATR